MIYSYDSKVSMLEWGHLERKAMLIATGSGEVSTHRCVPIASPSGEFWRRLPGQMGSGYGPVVEGVGGANALDKRDRSGFRFLVLDRLLPDLDADGLRHAGERAFILAADQSEIPAGLFHPTSELFPS